MGRKRLAWLSAAALVAAASLSQPMFATAAAGGEGKAVGQRKFTNNAYIVQLADDPVVAYRGDVKGYAATRPRKGQKIDPNSPEVVSYMSFLTARQDALLASVTVSWRPRPAERAAEAAEAPQTCLQPAGGAAGARLSQPPASSPGGQPARSCQRPGIAAPRHRPDRGG